MSIWADRQIHALNRKVEELQARILLLERTVYIKEGQLYYQEPLDEHSVVVAGVKLDKRTREYKEWKTANS